MELVYVPNSDEIAVEAFDDGTVMINFLTGRYYAFNETAEWLWRILETGATRTQLRDVLAQRAGNDAFSEAFDTFFDVLVEERLLARRPDGTTPSAELPDLPLASVTAPVVEIFDDLADLILLDPIHDVNEQFGWPVARPEPEKG